MAHADANRLRGITEDISPIELPLPTDKCNRVFFGPEKRTEAIHTTWAHARAMHILLEG